jgi:3-isopropylmalate/(R)-2-methylmalate dehydratase small subunit
MNKGGRVWLFGDDIDTDVLAPGLFMKGPIEELARHCLEAVDPSFAGNVMSGDIIVAGTNFGIGSSREQAPQILKLLGVSAIVARSYGGIFYRNAMNLGLLAVTCNEVPKLAAGDQAIVHGEQGLISNLTTGEKFNCEAVPAHMMEMIAAGGLVPFLEIQFADQKNKKEEQSL